MLGSLTNVPVPVEVYKMHLDLLKSTQMFLLIFHLLLGRLTRFRVHGFKSPYRYICIKACIKIDFINRSLAVSRVHLDSEIYSYHQ